MAVIPLDGLPIQLWGGRGMVTPTLTSESLKVSTARAHGSRPGSPLSKAEVQGCPQSKATRGRPSDLSFEFQRQGAAKEG